MLSHIISCLFIYFMSFFLLMFNNTFKIFFNSSLVPVPYCQFPKKDCEKKKFDKEKVGNSSTIVCKVVSLEVSIYRILQALRRILRI